MSALKTSFAYECIPPGPGGLKETDCGQEGFFVVSIYNSDFISTF